MMEITVKDNIKEVQRQLSRLQRKQLPFATSMALNNTAFQAQRALKKQAPIKMDRPTKFTVNAFQVKKSSKRNLVATVFVNENRADYLKYQIHGGTRVSKGRGTGVPTRHKKLNAYGNVPGRRSGLVKGKKQFIATIKGVPGVWQRYGRGGRAVKLMVGFEKQVTYRPRFPFYKIVGGLVRNRFQKNMEAAIVRALQTSR